MTMALSHSTSASWPAPHGDIDIHAIGVLADGRKATATGFLTSDIDALITIEDGAQRPCLSPYLRR